MTNQKGKKERKKERKKEMCKKCFEREWCIHLRDAEFAVQNM